MSPQYERSRDDKTDLAHSGVISVLLGCGMFTQADAPVSRGESPLVSVSSVALPILFHGDSLIEEKILASPIVVRATITALSSEVIVDADDEFRA